MELIVIILCFVVLWGGMIYLSSTKVLQGWKTRITVIVLGLVEYIKASAPEALGAYVSPDGLVWVTILLAVTALLGVQLRKG